MALSALDFLSVKTEPTIPAVVICFGEDDFLRRLVRKRIRKFIFGEGDDFSSRTVSGKDADLAIVMDDLRTVSMFGAERTLVLMDAADDFVTQHRTALESYVQKPSSAGVLVLDVRKWPKNTRLYKTLDKTGMQIDCAAPKPGKLRGWLSKWSSSQYGAKLDGAAAESLVEIIGSELGLLDQELAKLAAYAGAEQKITAEMVRDLVGGWRAKTTWEMLDAALGGDAREALTQLDRLLNAGEHPVALLGPIGFTLRRFATAARTIDRMQSTGKRITVRDALSQAGIKPFVMAKSEAQLRQIGPVRAARLDRWLLNADLDLKGASRLAPRMILERLVCQLSRSVKPQRT
ncbi:MAG: DNA polymerase III subunit delta [Pirellulales bacterium]|nr:DNA polymerase III subunit delta [Pirellulales bacterium]